MIMKNSLVIYPFLYNMRFYRFEAPLEALIIADSIETATSLYFEQVDADQDEQLSWEEFSSIDEFLQESVSIEPGISIKNLYVLLNYANTRFDYSSEPGFVALKKQKSQTIAG